MKKIIPLFLACFFSVISFAQTNPNRILIHEKTNAVKGFLAERVDSITFAQIEGEVSAAIKISEVVSLEEIKLSITRSENCESFKIFCAPTTIINRLTDDAYLADYINSNTQELYNQDFTDGSLKGFMLQANAEYAILTLGFDKYGVPCTPKKEIFRAPKKPTVGDPKVETTFSDIQQRSFTGHFTPNADVAGYAAVAAIKGTMMDQYNQFGPMMGFQSFSDMIKSWGQNETGPSTFTWNDMEPGTDYEVFVQAWDVQDTYADCDTLLVTTKPMGGAGAAKVSITLGAYKMSDWDNELKPSQFIKFTPNDQTSRYRFSVALAENYDKEPENFKNDLRQDPPQPNMANWFFFEPLETDFQINPNTEFVVLTIGKNANNEWGEFTVERFTTPAQAQGAPAMKFEQSSTIQQRNISVPENQDNTIPTWILKRAGGMRLTE